MVDHMTDLACKSKVSAGDWLIPLTLRMLGVRRLSTGATGHFKPSGSVSDMASILLIAIDTGLWLFHLPLFPVCRMPRCVELVVINYPRERPSPSFSMTR